jgi:type I restriction enzyme S subunit
MARAKKEAALTPEERLQAALVPDWAWPYKLPGNWCWTRITVITDILNGFAFKSQHYSSAGIRIIRITNVQDGFIQDKKPVYYPLVSQKEITPFMLKDGDFLMSLTGNVGRVAIIDASFLPAALNQRVACLRIKSEDSVRKEYIFYFCLQKQFVSDCIKSAKGSAQLNMSTEWLKEYPIPLPPLAEQQRIVDRIKSLFAKLDEAKEKAQAVVDSFETRKAAILHKAFTGELTAKWRRTHGLSLDTWKEVAADSLFEYVTSGSRGWAKYYDESGAVFIRMGNLDHGTIELDFSDIQHVKLPNKAEGQRSRIRKNDILISITADVGMVGLVRNDDFEAYINQHIALARPVMSESAEFIAWYLVSDIGLKQMQEKQRGATKVGLSLNDIRALQLKIPLIEEQNEILKVIKMWIGKEHQAKEAAEVVLDQIDLMKKSILARAFRGELGTNDPSEESAVELLKQLI